MPFGLKLRRTRRYNVLSKNCFVTRIRLLDSSVIECTLSVESTGQECLEAVAQRLELRETHYFGLWFLSKSQQARWVELEKPLKKHLDKFANEPLLFFGVMFYVPNVSWLQQEATRYQYYLQVKKDVLEGRLRCSLEQVIRLAGLAVQADFGDYNQFDSQDFLREYVLFPMDLALEEAVLEDSIIEREMMIRNLEKQKMAGLEAQKRPLMLAALNGLSVARGSGREESRVDATRVPMDERFRTLKKKLEEGMVFTEYEQIPKKKANGIFSTAALPENAERSRIREVVPYEENRVELIPTKENNTGYINASHIKEGGRTKSHRYWPKLGSKHSSATYGKFKVTTKFRTDSGCYATTGLKVKHLLSGQERTVWHLQYTDWPDHGCPEDVQGFLSYLEEIQSVRRHTNSMLEGTRNLRPPIVVHCSAGVGRTGVVILSELMIYCLEHNEKVEVPMMLRLLREQRMFMIQTIAQYKFVYQVLIQFLQNSRLI